MQAGLPGVPTVTQPILSSLRITKKINLDKSFCLPQAFVSGLTIIILEVHHSHQIRWVEWNCAGFTARTA
jgi:hypothetical protein